MASKVCHDGKTKFGLNAFQKNWFTENGTLAENYAWSMLIKKILHQEKTEYEDILVFDSERFGRCLALGDYVQSTENDEFVLNEMMAFLPLNSHPQPRKVLIVGGYNAGIAREANKHASVESIVLCEPDKALIKVFEKHLPHLRKGLQSSKLKLIQEDAIHYLERSKEEFDVIITDLPDATEEIAALFDNPCFKIMNAALKPGGIFVTQAECFWFDADRSKEFLRKLRTMFPMVDYATSFVPSVPGGQRGIVLCGTSTNTNFREPLHKLTSQDLKKFQLRYYTPDVHRAAFALPSSIREDFGLKPELSLN